MKINHICPKCNFYIFSSINKHIESCSGQGPRRKIKRGKRGGWNKGINYVEKFGEKWMDDYSNKLSISAKKSYLRGNRNQIKNEDDRRKKISDKMKEVGGGYRKGSGRGKKGWYKGYWCDSSWELAYVIYNIDHEIRFERNNEYFYYILDSKERKYFPDFKIDDKYIEIKGYFTEQTKLKIEQFEKNLILIDKDKIKPFIKYAVDNYGKNFINLYENGK